MEDILHPTFDARLTTSTLEQELRLVAEAVNAVASGHFPRVTVVGLRFGEDLLRIARADAEARGVRVTPLFYVDEHGADLLVERLDEGGE